MYTELKALHVVVHNILSANVEIIIVKKFESFIQINYYFKRSIIIIVINH